MQMVFNKTFFSNGIFRYTNTLAKKGEKSNKVAKKSRKPEEKKEDKSPEKEAKACNEEVSIETSLDVNLVLS